MPKENKQLKSIAKYKRQENQLCSLVKKKAPSGAVCNSEISAIDVTVLPKKTLVGIAMIVHDWESKQSWYDREMPRFITDNPLSYPANYIQMAYKRAQMYGNTPLPVVAQAPTKDSMYFRFIMELLKVKIRTVSV